MFLRKNQFIKKQVEKTKLFFKFIVDGIWRYSTEYPQAPDDNGNLNNYLDLRDPERSIIPNDIGSYDSSDFSNKEEEEFNQINDIEDIMSELNLEMEAP